MLDLPTLDQAFPPSAAPPAPPQDASGGRGLAFVSGLKSGLYGAGASLAGAYQGAAKIVGADGLADRYGQTATDLQARAAAAGRPDLEAQGFFSGGIGGFLSKAAYTAGQAVPSLVGAGAAGAGAVALLPEEAALAGGTALGRLGASLPKLLGGSGAGAGFAADVAPEALVSGARTAAAIGGAGGVMGVQSAGEQVNTAAQQPGGLTRAQAVRAFAQGLPIGIAQGIVPGEGAILARGGETALTGLRKGLLGTVADHSLKNAAAGAVGSGLQAAADTSFNPNMTAGERASAIVSAATSGAQAGGLFGAGFGLFAGRSIPDQMAAVDKELGDASGSAPAPPPPSAPPAPEPVQQAFTFSPHLATTAEGTQPGLFDAGFDAKGSPIPYDAGSITPRAQRSDKSVLAEVQAAIAAREAAKPAEPEPQAAPTIRDAVAASNAADEPKNGFLKDMLKAAGLKVGSGKGDFPEFVAGSTATNEAELHNELHAVDPTSKLSEDRRFLKLADLFGVGDPGLDDQLRRVLNNPTPDEAQAKALFFKVGVRDAALKLREAPPVAEAPREPAVNERVDGQPPVNAGVDTAPQAAQAAAPVQVEAPAAQLAPPVPEPAIKPPAEAAASDVPQASQEDIQQQLRDLIAGVTGGQAEPRPAASAGEPSSRVDPSDAAPKAITDRVLEAARSAVGDKGGEVSIADLRKALPDVAAKDLENALREIHGDDSDTALTQAPKGQRTGVDGVSVPGLGKFHNLELEARDGGVQERGAAPEAAADQPGGRQANGGGDLGRQAPAGAGEAARGTEGREGSNALPGQQDQAPLTPAPTFEQEFPNGLGMFQDRDGMHPVTPDSPEGQAAMARIRADRAAGLDHDPLKDPIPERPKSRVKAGLIEMASGMDPQVVADKNAIRGWIDGLSDADYHTLNAEYGGRLVGEARLSAEPAKLLDLMKADLTMAKAKAASPGAARSVARIEPLSTPEDTRRLLDPATYRDAAGKVTEYPGDDAMAKLVGVDLDSTYARRGTMGTEAGTAITQRLRGIYSQMTRRAPDLNVVASAVRDIRDALGHRVPTETYEQDPVTKRGVTRSGNENMLRELQGHALAPDVASVTRDAIAPQDPPPAPQASSQRVTENVLVQPSALKGQVTRALRTRAKAETAVVKTARGDQVPTATVGGQITDLPQAAGSAADALRVTAPRAKGAKAPVTGEMSKVAADRMPGIAAPALLIEQTLEHFDRFVSRLNPDVAKNVHLVGANTPIEGSTPLGSGETARYVKRSDGSNEVYLNADNVRSRGEVEAALSHEIFGHYAVSANLRGPFMRTAYERRMNDVFNRAGGREGIEKLARQLGIWAEGDDGGKLNGAAGLSAYFPPEGTPLTPFLTARLTDELIAHRAEQTPSALSRGIQQVQALLRRGLVTTMRGLGLTEFAKRMDRFGQPELSQWVAQSRKALTSAPKEGQVDLLAGATTPRHFLYDAEPTGEPLFMSRLAGTQRDSEGVMGAMDALRNHVARNVVFKDLFGERFGTKAPGIAERLRDRGRTVMENLAPANGIAEEGQRTGMTGLLDHFHLGETDRAIRTRVDGIGNRVIQDHMDLRVADNARSRVLDRVMDVATSNNLDPRRSFADHKWLSEGRTPEDVEALRALHTQLQKDYNVLGQPMRNGKPSFAQKVYGDHVALSEMNWYMARAMHTFDALKTVFDGKVDAGYEPSQRFAGLDEKFRDGQGRQLAEDHFGDVGRARDYWKGEFERLNAAAEQHMTGEGTREGNAGTRPYQDLEKLIANNREGEDGYVKQGPYFRRGRQGDYAVGFKLPALLDAEGKPTDRPDPAALSAIQKGYAKDFPQVSIGASDTNRQVFARFSSEEQARNFAAKVQQGGELRRHIDQEHGTHVSLLAHSKEVESAIPFLQQHLDAARARFDAELSKLPEGEERSTLAAQRDKYVGTIRSTIMDLAGETSMRSIQSQRENVQGSNADMLENQKSAAATYARATSSVATRAEKSDALFQARQAIEAVGRSGSKDAVTKSARMQRIYNAYESRNAAADVRVDDNLLSHIKSGLHTYTLGASPAYIIMNMSQLGTLALPEFAKFHGHAASVAAMAGALGKTGRVLAAMVRTGGIVDGGITKAVLDKSGLSVSERNFLSTLVNHDHIELGSYSAANSGLGVGNLGRVGRFLHYANSTALLAETAGRLVTAFAAKKLYDGLPAGAKRDSLTRQFGSPEDYAGHVVGESMLRWGSYNTPKLFTAGGALGKFGPVVSQFHGFVPRMIEKVYRESLDGFTSRLGTSPEAVQQKAEARRFVMSHLAAVIAISGGLGLPMAGYAAGAATRLSGVLLDQPYDFSAHIRGFMADTFGKDLGEVLSRGLPRYLGVDMSDLGDEGWGPMTRLMESRQKLEDAVPEYLAHAWGSAPGAGLNMALGIREMLDGRWSEAGARMLPTSMRNLARAYRVSQYGYVNGKGEALPIPAGGTEILKTALGLEGGEEAEEHERQEAIAGLKNDRTFRSSKIKRDVTMAVASHDQAGLNSAMEAARSYDLDNPGLSLSRQLGGVIQKNMRETAYGLQSGTLGLKPQDIVGRGLTGF